MTPGRRRGREREGREGGEERGEERGVEEIGREREREGRVGRERERRRERERDMIERMKEMMRKTLNSHPAVHGAMGCGQKSFKLVWRCHQLLSGFLAKGHLPRVSRQSRRSLMISVIMK